METKKLSSAVVYIKSKIQDFVLQNKNVTEGFEFIIDKLNFLETKRLELDDAYKAADAAIVTDYKAADAAIVEKIETITFESECDIEIEYIPDSGNKFKVTRIKDDLMFESTSSKLEFNITHDLGLIPIVQIYTKLIETDEYSYTLTDFIISDTTIKVLFTEPVFCRIVFKA